MAPDGSVAWTVARRDGGAGDRRNGSRATSRRRRSGWSRARSIPTPSSTLRDVGVNPTRRAVIDLLRSMGADIEERPTRPTGRRTPADDGVGEPLADLVVRSSALRAIDARPGRRRRGDRRDPDPVPGRQPRPTGTTVIRGAGELRHKESDRIAGIAAGLRALGARVEVDGDDLAIDGGAGLRGAATDSLDDHRLAMTFAIAGLVADRRRRRSGGPARPPISYPGFFDDLERVRA